MRSVGPVALLGGREHRAEVTPVDRWLVDHVGRSDVRVTVVPAASGPRSLPPTAALARNYWRRLGARVSIALPGRASQQQALEALEQPDIIVLTGGVPDRVIAALGASAVWDRILRLWLSGAALSGSSAGAMALFEWRLRLRPPHPSALVPGLGPLSGYVALPHFDRYVGESAARRRLIARLAAKHDIRVLGIDEGTGLVGWDGMYSVLGLGGVTVRDGNAWHGYRSGSVVPLVLTPAIEHSPVATPSATSLPAPSDRGILTPSA